MAAIKRLLPRTCRGTLVAATTLLICGTAGTIAWAENQPPPGRCPEKIGCAEVRSKTAGYRPSITTVCEARETLSALEGLIK